MKKIVFGIGIVLVVLMIAYYYLGGTRPIQVKQIDIKEYQLAGITYKGRYRDTELEETYFYVKRVLDEGKLSGDLVVINYPMQGDSSENGFINQFIGIQLEGPIDELPDEFKKKTINVNKAIVASIEAHNLVMPSPNDIEKKITNYALENNLETVDYTIEKYISDRSLHVEVPVIKDEQEKAQ